MTSIRDVAKIAGVSPATVSRVMNGTANVNEEATVVDLGKEDFYIECMDCIKIDEGEWHEPETCSECIKEQTL